jgi:peptide/nickel transport system substrate-binding protein
VIVDAPTTRRGFLQAAGALGALTLPGVLSACGGDGDSSSKGGTPAAVAGTVAAVSWHMPVLPRLYEPAQNSSITTCLMQLGLEPLMYLDPSGEMVPNLAENFEQKDEVTYVYTLRSGVKFWDGTPLTPEDVLFSINIHREKKYASQMSQVWAGVERMEFKGNVLTVRLKSPDFEFRYAVGQTPILSKAYYLKHGNRIGNPETLNMGTGPYVLKQFEPRTMMRYERNADYWGDHPGIETLELRGISDDSARLLALRSGEIDGIIQIPLVQASTYAALPDFTIGEVLDHSVYKFNFELTTKPWDDIHLRRAFAHLIDRAAITEGVMQGQAEIAQSLIPPDRLAQVLSEDEIKRAYEEIGALYPAYDLEAAKRELAQSSVPDGLRTTLLVAPGDPNLSAIAQTVAQTAREIGITIEVKEVDDTTYFDAVYFKHQTDGLSVDWFSANGPDVSNLPQLTLSTATGYPQGSGVNIANYSNPDVDRMLTEIRAAESNDAARGKLIVDVLKQAATDLPYVPIFYPKMLMGLSNDYVYTEFDAFWWMEFWPKLVKNAS